MSRIAKRPVFITKDVIAEIKGQCIKIQGRHGEISKSINRQITLKQEKNKITFFPIQPTKENWAQAGTARSIVQSMVQGVKNNFVKKLKLVGVGYRATIKKGFLELFLGFSHPVIHQLPAGICVECPSVNEIVLKSVDKQLLGQVAADIRAYRPPEPYKGKGVRYHGERVQSKEPKKK